MSLDFSNRHIGIDADARQLMLDALGYASLDALMDAAVPAAIRQTAPLLILIHGLAEQAYAVFLNAYKVRMMVYNAHASTVFTGLRCKRNIF